MFRKVRNLLRLFSTAGALFAAIGVAHAQWDYEDSHTTANLRGIDSPSDGIAWASGTDGTVLHTEDGGKQWRSCAMPPGAEKLDFRGIRAFDANTAIVMSSGLGELSRLYTTANACASWKLLLANPDEDGFWDSVKAADPSTIIILGEPVGGAFQIRETHDGGATWTLELARPIWMNENASTASNSALSVNWEDGPTIFGTSSIGGARIFRDCYLCKKHTQRWVANAMEAFKWDEFAGISAIHQATWDHLVAVGGDSRNLDTAERNAAWSNDGGMRWHLARTSPHGYRSAIDYDPESRAWITVGPNGTDISHDDGRDWEPLTPAPDQPVDADKNWNAMSFPFVVGPNGRIGKLRDAGKL